MYNEKNNEKYILFHFSAMKNKIFLLPLQAKKEGILLVV